MMRREVVVEVVRWWGEEREEQTLCDSIETWDRVKERNHSVSSKGKVLESLRGPGIPFHFCLLLHPLPLFAGEKGKW